MIAKLLYIVLLALSLTSLGVGAQTKTVVQSHPLQSVGGLQIKKHPLRLRLKSMDNDNGSGVTRIGIDMLSMPSTSSRVDSATIVNGKIKKRAIDIDGVDFGRYFQWEEEGVRYIELDFPKQKRIIDGAKVILHTVHGNYVLSLDGKTKAEK